MCSAPEPLSCPTLVVVFSTLVDGPCNRHSDFVYIRPMVLLESTVQTIGKKTSMNSVFRWVYSSSVSMLILNPPNSEDDGILVPRYCPTGQLSSSEGKLEAMPVLSQIWKFFQRLPAVTSSIFHSLLPQTPTICILLSSSFRARISLLVSSRLFSFGRNLHLISILRLLVPSLNYGA